MRHSLIQVDDYSHSESGDMVHKTHLAEDRKEQLYRAWCKHEEHCRQRERERAMRDWGV